MRAWLRTGASIGSGLWLAACAEEVSIGDDACPRGAQCAVERLDLPQASVDVHSTGPSLEPAWKTSVLQVEGSVGVRVGQSTMLATGPAGALWVFTPEPGHIQVTLLDAAGTVVDQATIEPPPGLALRDGILPRPRAAASHQLGPVAGVEWTLDCPPEPPQEQGCPWSLSELLVFGASRAEPEGRGSPYPINSLVQTFETIHRSAEGDAVFVTSTLGDVGKVDLKGNVLWEGDLSLDDFDQLPNTSTLQSAAVPFRSGTVSPEGDLVFSIDTLVKKSEAWDWRYFPAGLLHIAEDGGRTVRLYDGGESGDNPVGEAPPSYSHAALAYDTRGRLLAVYEQLDGDLLVLRMTDDHAESFRILREDYADLQLYDTAMDPSGTLYISSQGGGRDFESLVPLLCRVPEEGSPDCVALPEATYDIEAPAAGVVFALLSGETELARFDFE